MNETKTKTVFEERDEAVRLLNKTSLELNKAKAQLAATEKALRLVQEESAKLRAESEAARKVADVAVIWAECDDLSCTADVIEGLESAVREYRAKGDGLGFFPDFPPDFDPKRAEKGLAQERSDQEIGRNQAEPGQI